MAHRDIQNALKQMAQAIDQTSLQWSEDHKDLNLKRWDVPAEYIAPRAALAFIRALPAIFWDGNYAYDWNVPRILEELEKTHGTD